MKNNHFLLLLLVAVIFVLLMMTLGALAHAAICVDADSVTLTWEPNTEEDLAGYKVYRCTQPDGSDLVEIADVQTTSYQDVGLTEGIYFYALKAYDLCGNISEFSELSQQVSIDLTPPVRPAMPELSVP